MSTIQTTTTVVFSNPAHVDQHIALSPSTRIVTLLHQGTILVQHRLSPKQFRLLTPLPETSWWCAACGTTSHPE